MQCHEMNNKNDTECQILPKLENCCKIFDEHH